MSDIPDLMEKRKVVNSNKIIVFFVFSINDYKKVNKLFIKIEQYHLPLNVLLLQYFLIEWYNQTFILNC